MKAQALQQLTPKNEEVKRVDPTITNAEIDEVQSRHIKGCNCKKSNCLKRYCECYLAKIQCSTLCKCIGCKNCDESTKTLLQLANAADLRKQQQQFQQQHTKFGTPLQSNSIISNQSSTLINNGALFGSSNGNLSAWQRNNSPFGNKNEMISNLNIYNIGDAVVDRSDLEQNKLQQQRDLK